MVTMSISLWLLLAACGMGVTLSCTKSAPTFDGLPAGCHVHFSNFCIRDLVAGYLLSIDEREQDLHGFVYLVTGTNKLEVRQKFVAVIRNADAGELNLNKSISGDCELYGVRTDSCDSRDLPSVIYKYRVTYKEDPSVHYRGIRIEVLQSTGVARDFVREIAMPCSVTNDGTARCATMLPECQRSIH